MKQVVVLFSLLILAILFLSGLHYYAEMPNKQQNGFKRKWIKAELQLVNQYKYKLDLMRISGISFDKIYLSSVDPGWVLVTNKSLKPTDTLLFGIKPTEMVLTPNITVDSPWVYMYANKIPMHIRGRVDEFKVDTIRLHTPIFMRFAQVSRETLVIRGLDSTMQFQVFKKLNCSNGTIGKENAIIKHTNDGDFSTDGLLNYDKATGKLVYVQTYQNRFYCIDTNLSLIYSANTIDTTFTNRSLIKKVMDGNQLKLMPANSRQIVNKLCETSNGLIYIVSNLRADNESAKEFKKNAPIDIYTIEDGKYIGSVHMPKVDNKELIEIKVEDDIIIALFRDGVIATFRL